MWINKIYDRINKFHVFFYAFKKKSIYHTVFWSLGRIPLFSFLTVIRVFIADLREYFNLSAQTGSMRCTGSKYQTKLLTNQ